MKINIKDKVDKLQISKNKLAQQLGISYPTMLDLYNGSSSSVRLDILEKLCFILECTPNDILQSEDINYNSGGEKETTDSIDQAIHDLLNNIQQENISSHKDKDDSIQPKDISYRYYQKKLNEYQDALFPYLIIDSSNNVKNKPTHQNEDHQDDNKSDTK